MTKGVKICFGAVIVVLVISVIASFILYAPRDKDSAQYVEILSNNEVVCKLDLNKEENRSFRIEGENGWNEITIMDGTICVSDADCPDKTCVKSGKLRNENFPIICLPHRLVIRFSEQGERNENKTTD